MSNLHSADNIWAALPAAGIGVRMASDRPKQYMSLAGKSVIERSLVALTAVSNIKGIVVGIHPDDRFWHKLTLEPDPRVHVTIGGAERADTVLKLLTVLIDQLGAAARDWVLVHDAVRPCVSDSDISKLIKQVSSTEDGGLLGCPMVDTVKRVDDDGFVIATEPRAVLWRAMTPQMFRIGPLQHALSNALQAGIAITDESSAMERVGARPIMIEGLATNIKITRPQDLLLANMILQQCK